MRRLRRRALCGLSDDRAFLRHGDGARTSGAPRTAIQRGRPVARKAGAPAGDTFIGGAQVSTGTTTVAITATDASGNTAAQAYEIDVDAAEQAFAHDANGNLTTQGGRTYEWNARNELVRVVEGSTELARFAYDG